MKGKLRLIGRLGVAAIASVTVLSGLAVAGVQVASAAQNNGPGTLAISDATPTNITSRVDNTYTLGAIDLAESTAATVPVGFVCIVPSQGSFTNAVPTITTPTGAVVTPITTSNDTAAHGTATTGFGFDVTTASTTAGTYALTGINWNSVNNLGVLAGPTPVTFTVAMDTTSLVAACADATSNTNVTPTAATMVTYNGPSGAPQVTVSVSAVTNVQFDSLNTTIGTVSLAENQIGALPVGYVCLLPENGNYNAYLGSFLSTAPTFTDSSGLIVNGASYAATTPNPNNPNITGSATTKGFTFQILSGDVTSSGTLTIAGLHYSTTDSQTLPTFTATTGAVHLEVGFGASATAACADAPDASTTPNSPGPTFVNIAGVTGSWFGPNADGTAAVVFENTEVCAGNNTNIAVLATDVTNSPDPLAAAPLEAALAANIGRPVGLLLTEPTSIDPATTSAQALMGVYKIYVVGGLLAVSQADLTQEANTFATTCGGLATATTISVVSGIGGITADDTALDITEYAKTVNPYTAAANAMPPLAGVTSTTYNDVAQAGTSGINVQNIKGHACAIFSDTDVNDAMAFAPIAYRYQIPMLETPASTPGVLGQDAIFGLDDLQCDLTFELGGPLALPTADEATIAGQVPGSAVVPIAGTTYTETATQIAKFETALPTSNIGLGWAGNFSAVGPNVILTNGSVVSDGLAAAAVAGTNEWPIIETVNPTTPLDTFATAELMLLGQLVHPYFNIQPLGGPLALPNPQQVAAQAALG